MTTTAPAIVTTESDSCRRAAARLLAEHSAHQMYDAECALHMARQAGVGEWMSAAYDRLHAAVLDHENALARMNDDD